MNQNRKVRLGIVGLEFGAEFIPIYQKHRNSEMYAICQRTKAHLDKIGDESGASDQFIAPDQNFANFTPFCRN